MKWGILKDFHRSICEVWLICGILWLLKPWGIRSEVLGSGKYSWPGLRKFRESSADTSSAPIRPWGWTMNMPSLVCESRVCATLSFSQLLTLGVHSRWSWLRISREVNMVLLPDWPRGHQGTTPPTLYESQTPGQFTVVAVRFAESLWYNQHRTCIFLSIMSHFKKCHASSSKGPSNRVGFSPGDAWEMKSKAVWKTQPSSRRWFIH